MNSEEPSPTDVIPSPSSEGGILREAKRCIKDENPDVSDSNLGSSRPDRTHKWSGANFHRTPYIIKFLGVIFMANATFFGGCCWWYYDRTRAEFIALAGQIKHQSAIMPEGPSRVADPTLSERIDSLQKQLAYFNKKIQSSEEQAAQYSRRFADLAAQISDISKPVPTPQPSLATATPTTEQPPTQSELILLKERNRLSAYADEAIATGARGPYERLWDSLDDPRLTNLTHAARSEILRVQDCYLSGQRVKYYGIQQYQIPVAEIFPDSAALAPAQLSDEQLIQILQNHDLAWQTRVKAAWYLGQRRTTKSAEALVKAVTEDPALDVVAEATFSFEQVTGYHAKLFEVQPLLAWWSSYNKTPSKATDSDPAN